jgi:hypothetical protein
MDYPTSTSVKPGQGVDLSSEEATSGSCVGGGRPTTSDGTSTGPQVITLSLRDNLDASTYFSDANVSASAQYQALAGSGSAKASYIQHHEYAQSNAVVSMYERVEQRLYYAPPGATIDEAAGPVDSKPSSTLLLNSDMRALVTSGKPSDMARFRATCGDGFVIAVVGGAELLATLTAFSVTSEDLSKFNGSADVRYGPASGSILFDKATSETQSAKMTTLDFFQEGGSGQATPIDRATLLTAVQGLPKAAAVHPYQYGVIVRAYSSLPNWPTVPPPSPVSPLDQILASYWRTDALVQTALAAETTPRDYTYGFQPSTYELPLNGNPTLLSALFDQLVKLRAKAAAAARTCYTTNVCDTGAVSNVDIYKLAVQLPLSSSSKVSEYTDFWNSVNGLWNDGDTFDKQKLQMFISLYKSALNSHGDCYQANHALTQTFDPRASALGDEVRNFRRYLTSAPAQLAKGAVEYYARFPAHSRCAASAFDADCALVDSDFVSLASNISLSTLILKDNWTPNLGSWGQCPGSVNTTPTFSFWIAGS